MEKMTWKSGTMLYPAPAVMVSCGEYEGEKNIITISWAGNVCSGPAMVSISVRPSRHSHALIKKTGEFVINLTTPELAYAADFCGVRSGRNTDKWNTLGLTPVPGKKVRAPLIAESPLSIECRVKKILPLGTHDMFLAEALLIRADRRFIDKKGAFDMKAAGLLCYAHGKYYGLGKTLGHFGFSVRKKGTNRK